jgi:hypothetical protein
MKIGYSMWGFLGSGIVDTPDGSRSYRRPMVDALIAAGHEVVFLQHNRDLFEARVDLRDRYVWHNGFPDLDALLLEWRWPLPGRNTTVCGSPGHTCDLHRQTELVDYYTRARYVPTVVWDLDRQLPADDLLRVQPSAVVCEFALRPTPGATTLVCPVPDAALDGADPAALAARPRPVSLVYVGNQYDRDTAFNEFFAPAARRLTHLVAGKWPRTEAWPHVNFAGRCAFDEVASIHGRALATVLLLPDRYAQVGHMTSRWFEALLAGCLPIIPAGVACWQRFAPRSLFAANAQEVIERAEWLRGIAGGREHADLIAECLGFLDPFRLSRQVAVLTGVLESLAGSDATRPVQGRGNAC